MRACVTQGKSHGTSTADQGYQESLQLHSGNKLANRAFRELQEVSRAISCFPGVILKATTTPTKGKVLRPCLAFAPVSQVQSHAFCMFSAVWEGRGIH